MQQLVTFVVSHWELFLALVVILALLVGSGMGNQLRGIKSISPAESINMINHQNAVVLDVREDKEIVTGKIINSIHVPLASLPNRLKELDKYKTRPLIVSCRTGNRSNNACATLKKNGFESVFNLNGGIVAWQNANLPLAK